MLRPFRILALAGVVVAVAGCAGGSARGPARAGSRVAPGQVASALFIQQWGQILWGLATSQTGTIPPSFGEPVLNPDGTVRLDITYPDGTTQSVVQSVPEFDGVSKTTIDWQVTSSDGLSVTYTSVVDDAGTFWTMADDTTELTGQSVLPGGLTQQFTVLTVNAVTTGQTTVQSAQSDGSTFTWQVPLAGPDFRLPDFSQPTTGTYTSAEFNIQFALSSATVPASRWENLSAELGGGLTGQFSLGADFSGSGQVLEGGELVALLSWTRTGDTDVSFLSAEHSAESPAGAALDFLIHRWLVLTGAAGPG